MKRIVRRRGAEESASRQAMHVASHAAFFHPLLLSKHRRPFSNKIIFQRRPSLPSWRTARVYVSDGFSSTELSHGWCSAASAAPCPLRTRNGFGAAPAQNDQNINTRTHSQAHATHPPPAGTIP